MNFAIRKTAPLKDSYIEINGARLRYRDEGAGFTVVFVHGWALDLDMWEPQAASLSAVYRIVRWDRRGFGLSSGRPSLVDDVTDLQALCRHLGLQRVALVGMSQGARVALQMTCASPAMVACLVLDGSPRIFAAPGTADDSQELPYEECRRLAQSGGLAAFRRQWMRHPLATLKTENVQTHELLARMLARYPGTDLIDPVPCPAVITTLPMIQSIAHPVLVVGGACDIESRIRFADELTRELPCAERAWIPDARHLCNLDNSSVYNSVLRNFLDRHAVARTNH